MRRTEKIEAFTEILWRWFPPHKRTLPWRDLAIADENERAYRILVSEVMLQQTQVSRVKIVFKDFLDRFAHLSDLAAASNRDVILAWRGMGYNNRALRLRDAAKKITGHFPSTMDDLLAIPGVGHYTAAAIRNFAFNLTTPCLDTNIRRILHRTFVGPEYADGTWKKKDAYLLDLAEEILECAIDPKKEAAPGSGIPRDARNWHAALMDFGSLVCTKRNPKWELCPLTKAGLMKAAYHVSTKKQETRNKRQEPGRMIGARFVPNRIIRGRIVEELRDARNGLSAQEIGRRVCIDWSPREHAVWLRSIIEGLKRDLLVKNSGLRIALVE